MSRSPHRFLRRPALLVLAAVTLVACSSGGGGSESSGGRTNSSSASAPKDGTAKTNNTSTDTASASASAKEDAAPAGEVATGKPVPSQGCGTATVKPVELDKRTLGERFYLLTVPKGADADTPLPLVLDFHGLLEGADVHAKDSQLSPYAVEHGFVLATPNGTGSPVHWEVAPDRKANPDLVFVDAMLDQIEADQCIDTSRIYSTGLSNGAFLSSTIACAMSDRIAAVAPVSGLTFTEECRPERPVPVLTFHGTADPILLFNGGVGKRLGAILAGKTDDSPLPEANLGGDGYPKAVRDWAKANGCKTTFEDEEVTDTVTERSYDCPPKGAVVFDIVEGGGHTWPGTKFSIPLEKIVGATDQTLDANDVLWKFFQRFRLPQS